METVSLSRSELKKLMREAFIDVLSNRKDLIEEAVVEALEDVGLGIAMREGKTGEYVDAGAFMSNLDSKIKRTK